MRVHWIWIIVLNDGVGNSGPVLPKSVFCPPITQQVYRDSWLKGKKRSGLSWGNMGEGRPEEDSHCALAPCLWHPHSELWGQTHHILSSALERTQRKRSRLTIDRLTVLFDLLFNMVSHQNTVLSSFQLGKPITVLPHVKLSSQSQLDILIIHIRWLRKKLCCNISSWHRHIWCTDPSASWPAGQGLPVKLPVCFSRSRWCLQGIFILGQILPWDTHGQFPFSIPSLAWWSLAHPTQHCKIYHSLVASQGTSVHNRHQNAGNLWLRFLPLRYRLGKEL